MFDPAQGKEQIKLPCGQCTGCRLDRSQQWAIRCVHESQLHDQNTFLTLTYDNEHLPADLGLHKRDLQLFLKRLRKSEPGKRIRYYACGEYTETGRPHFHLIVFGHEFADQYLWETKNGNKLYRSDQLEKLWPNGYSRIGTVTYESAAYVARYIMKKITGLGADQVDETTGLKPYELYDSETGEIIQRIPEYTTMSLKPATPGEPGGIGGGWYEKYKSEVYPHDRVVINGKRMQPPKYYDKCLQIDDEPMHEAIKARRKERAAAHAANQTPERLSVRRKVTDRKIDKLKRSLQ